MSKLSITDGLVDAVFPPACPICGRPRPFKGKERLRMCPECRDTISYIDEPVCLKCGKSIQEDEQEFCMDCTKNNHIFDQSTAVYEYNDSIKKSIYNYKYKNKREYAGVYALEINDRRGWLIRSWGPQIIVPVPIHASKLRVRKFNQAELIAKELGKILGIPVLGNGLVRVRKTIPMKELSNEGRIKNLKNAFQVSENVVKYNKVLIVDDIYTTGATMDACAQCLKESGVDKVYGVSLCIGNGF